MKKFSIVLILFIAFFSANSFAKSNKHSGPNLKFREWAKTPPMGWNSWDCYGPTVVEKEVKANADYMAKHLKKYGWQYIIVDIRWYVDNPKANGYNVQNAKYEIDKYGRYQPSVVRFPSSANGKGFKPLADYIHHKGLKFGIHIMRGIPKIAVERNLPIKGTKGITADMIYSKDSLCQWLQDNYTVDASKPGAQQYYNSLMDLYAKWGVDFIKVDDLSRPYHRGEIDMIRKAIDQCGRHIVFSTSPGETPIADAEHVSTHANMWRMVDDLWDQWGMFDHLMHVCQKWYPYIAPGTWPDCDMIPLGRIAIRGERGHDRMTRLTKNEQYSLMTLFMIFRSPLFFGGDLPSNDAFTLSLLTNKAVLKVHHDGTHVHQIYQKDGKVAITSIDSKTGDIYLALFNMTNDKSQVGVSLKDLGLGNNYYPVTNLWTGEKVGIVNRAFNVSLAPHASGLYKFGKTPQ